jgi:plastocyanin domain-containing protein
MSLQPDDIAVVAGAVVAIVLVLWYFLGPRGSTRAATGSHGIQEVTIRVEGGYDPSIVEVVAGQPVRLIFDRRENNPCSDELVLRDFGIKRDLPPFERTTIEVTPPAPGRYEFMCGMGMLHGALVAR